MDGRSDLPRAFYQRERHLPFLRRNIERGMSSEVKSSTRESHETTRTRNESRHSAPSGPSSSIEAPDIPQRLFDSITREPLRPKARVREGEDDSDEAWRVSKQIDSLVANHNISDLTKDYIRRWNTFMMRLKLSSNVYLAEALVEFVTDEKEWFRQREDRIREFFLHANVLRLRGIITVDCILGCILIIRATRLPIPDITVIDTP